jgi:SAM-dependent methyltransferase
MNKIFDFFLGCKIAVAAFNSLIKIKRVSSIDFIYDKYGANPLEHSSCSLDLGCGPVPKNYFHAQQAFGVDLVSNEVLGIKKADLIVEPIPFQAESMDFITAYDFLEHIPRLVYCPERRAAFVEIMNSIWTTLKPGGYFLSYTPVYPFSASFRDPTHVNIITSETFRLYFDDTHQWAKMYGFEGAFMICEELRMQSHLVTLMKKVSKI